MTPRYMIQICSPFCSFHILLFLAGFIVNRKEILKGYCGGLWGVLGDQKILVFKSVRLKLADFKLGLGDLT